MRNISLGGWVLLLLAAVPSAASAATVELGAVSEIRAGVNPTEPSGGGEAVQLSEAAGTYAVPAGYGVITAWEHRTGTVSGRLTFKVYRPTGEPGRFFTVASDPQAVTAGAGHAFAVRIPVQPGDRLGLSSPTNTVHLAYRTFNPADQFAFFPVDSDPAAGTTVTQDGAPATGYRLDVAARVESDLDGDGFGDESQDRCPTNPSTQSSCPAPAALPAFSGCSARAANVIRGTASGNVITGSSGGDRVYADAGNDTVDGAGGNDCLDLGSGSDRGNGGRDADLVRGGPGADRLGGGSGNDRLDGDSGGDRLAGGSGRDRIAGGSGNDRIGSRDRRKDRISCGSGRDRVAADRIDRVSRDCERVSRRR